MNETEFRDLLNAIMRWNLLLVAMLAKNDVFPAGELKAQLEKYALKADTDMEREFFQGLLRTAEAADPYQALH